ncbi:uncharacterized protein LOC113867183 [Abrus precatorius]|uniref:Uncharacterized protein LOC113867183 n=1 Tax=Abrus precatorius TaxID=3816 RepID=A0A8B8LRM0_ABRPR|nr:uncharacterized protein LOC113867183 [Abrus precatorius]
MGNENHHQHQFHYHKSTFLPMLCSKPSIKEVTLPQWTEHHPVSSNNDPLSPRISCMGQVKRNNKIAGIPTSNRFNFITKSSITSPVVKYSKLKKLFSGKNFIISTPPTTKASTTISMCGTRQRVGANGADVPKNQKGVRNENNNKDVVCVSIENMDPPLPVMKRVPKLEEDSLWKRRSGTGRPALKSLHLQQIHHPRICLQPPTV